MSEQQTVDLTNPQTFEAELAKLETEGDAEQVMEETAVDDSTAAKDEDAAPEEQVTETEEAVVVTDKGKMVPYSRVKEMAQKNQEERDARIKSDERLAMLMDAVQSKQQREVAPQQEQAAAKPSVDLTNPYDINVQPVEYLARDNEIKDARIKALENKYESDKEEAVRQNKIQSMFAKADKEVEEAALGGEISDAKERREYVLNSAKEMFKLFSQGSEERHRDMVRNFALSTIDNAKDLGITTAEMIKRLSDTFGYQPKAKAETPSPKTTRNIDTIQANKGKSATLSSSASTELNGAPAGIKSALNKNGRGTNEEAFYKMMKQLES